MDLKKIIISIVAVAVAVAVYFMFFHDNDRRAVMKRFNALMEAVEKPSGEGNISMAAKFQSLSNMVDDHLFAESFNPAIRLDEPSDVMLSNYATARSYAKSISLSAKDVEIIFTKPDEAQLTCFGTARITSRTGETFDETRPAILVFKKKDGKWLLSSASERQIFKRQ
ncbi:MAG: hypothetical protein J6X55_07500 [Victivallales bacterium]|nr:hypothetical protein [Victivallales bacterium]